MRVTSCENDQIILVCWRHSPFFFFPFRVAFAAYGGSQARGQIGAVATGLPHSSRQCWLLNPLSEARDPTHNLMVPSQIRFHGSTTGIPHVTFLKS